MKNPFIILIAFLVVLLSFSCSGLRKYSCIEMNEIKKFQKKEHAVIKDSSFVRRLRLIESFQKNGVGYSIWLPNVYFDFGCDGTTNLSVLDDIITVMKQNKKIKLQINGKSEKAEHDKDSTLSYKRAKFIEEYITSYSIDRNRLIPYDYGFVEKVNPEEESNRQVELYFVSKKHNYITE